MQTPGQTNSGTTSKTSRHHHRTLTNGQQPGFGPTPRSGQPALLPQLKRLNPDGTYPEGSSTDNLLAGQPSLATVDFLSVQPDPASSIENLGGGDGSTAATPIRIRNAVELAYLARQVNNGGQTLQLLYGKSIDNTADDNLKGFAGYHFALSDDIDLKRQNWTPIGNEDSPFMGNFNGDGHVIKGLKISIHNETDADVYAGLVRLRSKQHLLQPG